MGLVARGSWVRAEPSADRRGGQDEPSSSSCEQQGGKEERGEESQGILAACHGTCLPVGLSTPKSCAPDQEIDLNQRGLATDDGLCAARLRSVIVLRERVHCLGVRLFELLYKTVPDQDKESSAISSSIISKLDE